MSGYQFPASFLWGCATAAYQVEGAAQLEGRGQSIWDTFAHTPGRTYANHTGDVAVDQYHRYLDDIEWMAWLGVKAYRFSLSWPRIFPEGYGSVNQAGLDYYHRLIDALLAHGLEPWVTLYHWDLPQRLQKDSGGWRSRDTAKYFSDYAAYVTEHISDRVTHFMTLNELFSFAELGYVKGHHAPGEQLSGRDRSQVYHHGLLGHGLAVRAIRAQAKQPVQVGLAENPTICVPAIETEEHIQATKLAMCHLNGAVLRPLMEGSYDPGYLEWLGQDATPVFTEDDMAIIGTPLDFVGINVYSPTYIYADPSMPLGYRVLPMPDSYPRLGLPWLHIGPQITYWGPRLLKEIWGVDAVYITENGCAADDTLTAERNIFDTDRVMFLHHHFIAAHRALSEGWPLKGYFVWSLLDNFEWEHGYSKRFGLFYVDYDTLERIPKLSAKFYREFIRSTH